MATALPAAGSRPKAAVQSASLRQPARTLGALSSPKSTLQRPHLPQPLSECVKDIDPDTYAWLRCLDAYEAHVEDTFVRKSLAVKEALCPRWDERAAMHTWRLRVHVYNVAHNQQDKDDLELTTYDMEDWTFKPPPSWLLRIQGQVVPATDAQGAPQDQPSVVPKFTSFFKKIAVVLEDETVVWEKSANGEDDSSADGIEICREGDTEMKIKILFFVDARTPQYTLSRSLAKVVGQSQSTLTGCIRAIWKYAKSRKLLVAEDPGSINTDETLRQLAKSEVETLSMTDLPELLKPHLMPPRPMELTHTIKLSGDWIENENSYDFTLEAPDVIPQDVPLLLEHQGAALVQQLQPATQRLEKNAEKVSQIVNEINERITRRNFFRAFAENPTEVINSLVGARNPLNTEPQKKRPLLETEDEFFRESVSTRRCETFEQSWVHYAVPRYLTTLYAPIAPQRYAHAAPQHQQGGVRPGQQRAPINQTSTLQRREGDLPPPPKRRKPAAASMGLGVKPSAYVRPPQPPSQQPQQPQGGQQPAGQGGGIPSHPQMHMGMQMQGQMGHGHPGMHAQQMMHGHAHGQQGTAVAMGHPSLMQR